MERIYLGSRPKRDKWNRADYRASTLSKALRGVTDFYKLIPTILAEDDFGSVSFTEVPIPLDSKSVPSFPVDALPKNIADYVVAVAESTQTPVDVAACDSLSVLSIGTQGKYVIRQKPDWTEPVNTYIAIFMPLSERKLVVCSLMSKPMNEYEKEWNMQNSAEIEFSKTEKSILE